MKRKIIPARPHRESENDGPQPSRKEEGVVLDFIKVREGNKTVHRLRGFGNGPHTDS